MEEADKASGHTGGGSTPRSAIPRAVGRLVAAGYHSALTLSVAEAVGPSKSYAQMGSRSGTALCTSLRGPHKDDAIPETQPPHESRYNDSLTGSNACATMALMSRAFLLSQSLSGDDFCSQPSHRLSTVRPPVPCFHRRWPGTTMHPSRPDVVLACFRTATLEPHGKVGVPAASRIPDQPALAVWSAIQRRKSAEPPAMGSTTRAGLS